MTFCGCCGYLRVFFQPLYLVDQGGEDQCSESRKQLIRRFAAAAGALHSQTLLCMRPNAPATSLLKFANEFAKAFCGGFEEPEGHRLEVIKALP
jgi:hypothetical protein